MALERESHVLICATTSGLPIPATNGCKMSMSMLTTKPQYLVRVVMRVVNSTADSHNVKVKDFYLW